MIEKLKHKLKKQNFISGFLANKNNFIVTCESSKESRAIEIINQYLQKI